MIKLEHVVLASPEQMDGRYCDDGGVCDYCFYRNNNKVGCGYTNSEHIMRHYIESKAYLAKAKAKAMAEKVLAVHSPSRIFNQMGPNDLDLMKKLSKGGPTHAKYRRYRRYINVYVDVTAPLYWWKEFETYRIGVCENPSDIEFNSCSTMHKIADKKFEMKDFSTEHLKSASFKCLGFTVKTLNEYRNDYLNPDAEKEGVKKDYWWQMIQLLPSSYNQKRTLKLNYEVLAGIYQTRKGHKLDEWRAFCKWIEELPYSEIITNIEPTTVEVYYDDGSSVVKGQKEN